MTRSISLIAIVVLLAVAVMGRTRILPGTENLGLIEDRYQPRNGR